MQRHNCSSCWRRPKTVARNWIADPEVRAPHDESTQSAAYTRALLAAGLKPDTVTRDPHDPVTPLGMAVRFDCAACVQALLAAGADARVLLPDGQTLLHEAGPSTVPLLFAAGLDCL